jgi:hypothetical protein
LAETGLARLMQPIDHLLDLGGLAMGSHPSTQTAQELAQRGTRPRHAMVMHQHLQNLTLRMIGGPPANAFGQRRRGQASFNTQLELQRMDRTQPWRQWFVEPPPDDHGAE